MKKGFTWAAEVYARMYDSVTGRAYFDDGNLRFLGSRLDRSEKMAETEHSSSSESYRSARCRSKGGNRFCSTAYRLSEKKTRVWKSFRTWRRLSLESDVERKTWPRGKNLAPEWAVVNIGMYKWKIGVREAGDKNFIERRALTCGTLNRCHEPVHGYRCS